MPSRRLTVLALAAMLGVGPALLARGLGVRPVQIDSSSMAPTVKDGEWIAVQDLDGESRGEVERGDIVMFRFPLGTAGRAIKRVVATGGDRVAIRAHSVTVNGHTRRIAGAPSGYAAHARVETVPPGHFFVVGDNAARSIDSRSFGAVPAREIVARHLVTLGTTSSVAALLAAIALAVILSTLLLLVARRRRRETTQ